MRTLPEQFGQIDIYLFEQLLRGRILTPLATTNARLVGWRVVCRIDFALMNSEMARVHARAAV
jgi:hypothetical protein